MIKKIKGWFIFKYYWYKRKLQFKAAKAKADQMHLMTGKRYFVVPTGRKLQVVDNTVIKVFNKNVKTSKLDINDLLKLAYYYTPEKSLTRKEIK
jgi:hypothetical protein